MTRFGYVMTTYFSVLAIGGLSFLPITPKLIWNASASTPIGLYAIQPAENLAVADLVAVNTPEPLASFLAASDYLPRGVPLLKRVAALAGQEICRTGNTIKIDGIAMGEAQQRDRLGRILPAWQGCRRLSAREVFLMNWTVDESLDGRYFGPIAVSSIVGRAIPLWTDEEGNGRFEWRVRIH